MNFQRQSPVNKTKKNGMNACRFLKKSKIIYFLVAALMGARSKN
jgi:hypothetical protein